MRQIRTAVWTKGEDWAALMSRAEAEVEEVDQDDEGLRADLAVLGIRLEE